MRVYTEQIHTLNLAQGDSVNYFHILNNISLYTA